MNSKVRTLTTMKFKEPDRVPLFEAWIESEILNEIGDGDPYKTREILGLDCMPIAIGHPKSTNAWRTGTDQWGRIFKDGYFMGGKVRTESDLEMYSPPLSYAKEWFPEKVIKNARKKYHETHALYYAFHDGCLGLSYMSMGLKEFFIAVHTQPELITGLMKRSTDWTIEMITHAVNLEVDFILFGDDVAFSTGLMMSPKKFKEIVLPSYEKIVKASEKVPLIWHSDGAIEPLLPMIVKAGFSGVHSLEPNAKINLGEIKKRYGDKLVLFGNMDVTNVLTQDNLQLVRNEVERCMRQGSPGGGYVFSSSNSLFKSMSTKAILEAYRYAREIGYYHQ